VIPVLKWSSQTTNTQESIPVQVSLLGGNNPISSGLILKKTSVTEDE
jgi:hypothetical protein